MIISNGFLILFRRSELANLKNKLMKTGSEPPKYQNYFKSFYYLIEWHCLKPDWL